VAVASDVDVSPLELARRASGLTLKEVAARLGCTQAAVSRYLGGQRSAPISVFLLLGVPHLQAEQNTWRRSHGLLRRPGEVTISVVTRLPKGLSLEEAREACVRAVGSLRGGGR